METELKIKGMHCKSCEMLLKDVAEENEKVTEAKADYKKGTLTITHEGADINKIKQEIKEEGYETQ